MAVFPPDERRIIRPNELDFTRLPLPSVTAIDTTINVTNQSPFGYGTGVVINPNYVLTAAHNLYDKLIENGKRQDAIRVSSSGEQNTLVDRRIGQGDGDPGANVDVTTGLFFLAPEFFDTEPNSFQEPKHDIAVIKVDNNDLISPAPSVGLIAFVNPRDAKGYTVQTAGYPFDNVRDLDNPENNPGIPDREGNFTTDPERQLRDLVLAPGSFSQTGAIHSAVGRRIEYTDNIDTMGGQSGSPIWHTLEGDNPRVLGVHSRRAARRNAGTLIDKEVYDRIIEETKDDSGIIIGNDLPENAIIGTDPSFIPINTPFSTNGNDEIIGTYRRERIIGNGGNDYLYGDGADDRLEGGEGNDILIGGQDNDELNGGIGEDVAVFLDSFENYEYEISESTFGGYDSITFTHPEDGTDTLKNIEWAEFGREQVDTGTLVASSSLVGIPIAVAPRMIPLPLTDGVETTEFVEVESTVANPNPNDPPTPPTISLTAPVSMLDGDVDYTLNISPYQPDTEYNVVYVIDTSISIDEVELQTIQDAYTDLTNFYINEGIAENINFGVVSYDSSGRFYTDSSGDINLTADEAIAALQNLTIDTRIGTRYYDGLNRADQFLLNSSKNPFETTGIGYFITDGQNSGDRFDMLLKARDVRELANFQAIGYYTDLGNLTSNSPQIRDINWIDSNQGVFIDDISDLSTELLKSDLADDIESVNILLDGEVVDTITPDVFTDSPLGLTYEGSVDGLDVSIDAENIITAEVVFTDESNFATTTIDYTVTAGESEAVDGEGNDIAQSSDGDDDPFERIVDGGDSDDEITLGYADRGANGGAGGDYIIGNNRDNILDGGAGNDTISAYEGDDRITTGAGRDKVDGGEGIDTVIYNDVAYQDNNISLRKAGNSVSYNNTDTLTDVEFIQLSDVRFSTDNLEVTPVVEVADLSISEGDSNLTTAQLDFNLSTPAPVDISFDYSSEDIGSATAGSDYTATSGTVIIPAGETSVSLNLEIIGDTEDEEIETFALNYSALSGATFSNDRTEYSTMVTIENAILPLVLNGDDNDNLLEGDALEDSISGGSGNDTLRGLAGNDTLIGGFDNDVLNGGVDDDSLYGGENSDILFGDNGQDRLEGEDGDDYLYGGNDNDRAYGGNGQDVIYGEGGNDWLRGVHSHDTLYGGEGNDTLYGDNGRDRLEGEDGDDYLYGGNDNDRAYGGNGEDRLEGEDGDDYLYGGNDNDRAYGGNGTDVIHGEGGNDWLKGVHSHDTLYGGEGNDTLFGDNGTDLLIGEDGDDTFGFNTNVAFNSQNLGVDVIHDFGDGNDVINLGRTTFTALSSRAGTGFSNPQEFAVVSQDEAVVNSDAYILYSSSTGNLFYNENGAEAALGNGGHFATLNDAPELIASNFTLSD